jgi:RNA polymerase sigma-70 factor (ECF subfamily)
LVELFQSGDSRAFEDLYARYFQRIYRYCLKRVGDPHEAEEIAQEAFTRAYCAMPRLEGERRFYPWLTVIASRLCVDTHRRRGRTTPTAEVELGVMDGGQEDILEEADRELLAQALDRVTPRHREVLRLREEEGLSYDQIAQRLGVRLGTIEALLFRARRALRREFHNLAGADSRLAGLPVIGWILRHLLDSRSRLVELAGQAAPLAAAGAMSVAIVVGGAVGSNHTPVAHAPRQAEMIEMQMPGLVIPSAISDAPTPQLEAPSVHPPTASEVPQAAPLGPTGEQLGVTTDAKAKQQADQMPVHAEVGPFFLGAEPDDLAAQATGPVLP